MPQKEGLGCSHDTSSTFKGLHHQMAIARHEPTVALSKRLPGLGHTVPAQRKVCIHNQIREGVPLGGLPVVAAKQSREHLLHLLVMSLLVASLDNPMLEPLHQPEHRLHGVWKLRRVGSARTVSVQCCRRDVP
eukprot:CAMPEP_0114239424 /NCGR_PEP_ID=MMETSP0058-20121206/8456_1 /TAXON_ID=36894 /ORGANISM="Pyramimonas parkeae, CCMP726" /LENGTH=132 /DNA_ID=CAMNT_0001351611 /DNA_START=368 /DNA_END=766 /DNA_ORIENTATION=+